MKNSTNVPDLSEARRLHGLGFKLCLLKRNSKRPFGEDWNGQPIDRFDESATGYGVILAQNELCSIDPDNAELAHKMLKAFGFDLGALLNAGVRSMSTRPLSGGRSAFAGVAGLTWITFAFEGVGTVLELRAGSPNLQDAIPGLIYVDKQGNACTQTYANDLRLDARPPLPAEFLAWWQRMSEDIDFKNEQKRKAGEVLGLTAHLSMASEGGKLTFHSPCRQDFNERHKVEELLERHGYERSVDGRYSPPTATGAPGVRAIPGKDDLWRSDHASDPLHGTFDAWCAYVRLDHRGDVEAAEEEFQIYRDANIRDEFEVLPDEPEPEPVSPEQNRWSVPEAIDAGEWVKARPAPDCIVENYLYADVAIMIAAGGIGKTTLILFEAVHIVLGRPLWGRAVHRPGPVLIVTAEDTREMMVARLRGMCSDLMLDESEQQTVQQSIRISDVSDRVRKLTRIDKDVVRPARFVTELIDACQDLRPVLVVIDPAVSFGVGEARVNDAEQGLIEAGRMIRSGLNCCVRYVHHTGKQNGRDKTDDQYSGRGGSAFADGARMVTTLNSYRATDDRFKDWLAETGRDLDDGEVGLMLAMPKLTYGPPQPKTYIVRRGQSAFVQIAVDRKRAVSAGEADSRLDDAVWSRVAEDREQGILHTRKTLDSICADLGNTRAAVRRAVDRLLMAQRLEERPVEPKPANGARSFLHAVAFEDDASDLV